MAKTYAGILGMLAFATVLARSVSRAGSLDSTLTMATICLFAFAGIGYLIGWAAEQAVVESARAQISFELDDLNDEIAAQEEKGE